jgi:hypothetical protein
LNEVPYNSEYGAAIFIFGGNLEKNVWVYVISIDTWFQLTDSPRNIFNAGVQVFI